MVVTPAGPTSASSARRPRSEPTRPPWSTWSCAAGPFPSRASAPASRLARQYGVEHLEAACRRGLEIAARSYGSINSILANSLDRQPLARASPEPELPLDPNIRGSRYYH
jgi:hypothetical protein